MAETRLAQQQKEKEVPPAISQGIWNGQNLTWANNTSHWSNAGNVLFKTFSMKHARGNVYDVLLQEGFGMVQYQRKCQIIKL